MQKLMTREEKAKKDKRNSMIIGIILIAVMVFSTAGYALFSGERANNKNKKIEYNKIVFSLLDDGLWHFNIDGEEFATLHNPKETENISFALTLNKYSYQNKPLYFYYDSEREGINEIARNIERFAERMQYACMENCTQDYPIKDCNENIIIIKEANKSLIKQEDNCAYIQANKEEIIRVSDAFVFRVLGI